MIYVQIQNGSMSLLLYPILEEEETQNRAGLVSEVKEIYSIYKVNKKLQAVGQ